jgi:hypothetical protein
LSLATGRPAQAVTVQNQKEQWRGSVASEDRSLKRRAAWLFPQLHILDRWQSTRKSRVKRFDH